MNDPKTNWGIKPAPPQQILGHAASVPVPPQRYDARGSTCLLCGEKPWECRCAHSAFSTQQPTPPQPEPHQMQTSHEWEKITGVRVLDNGGWRDKSRDEPITKDEFFERCHDSRCHWPRAVLDSLIGQPQPEPQRWTPAEREAIDRLKAEKDMSEPAIIRQALRCYQMEHERKMGRVVDLGPKVEAPEPQQPTDAERAHAFEWLRKLGLEGTTQEARLAYVAMQTMLMAAPAEPQAEAVDGNGLYGWERGGLGCPVRYPDGPGRWLVWAHWGRKPEWLPTEVLESQLELLVRDTWWVRIHMPPAPEAWGDRLES